MAQIIPLVETLKASLKQHGLRYADVAAHLGLSEASVKRLFSERSFTLQRLDQVCQLMGMEISDLVQVMNAGTTTRISELSEEQEREIAGDLELLLVTVCLLNRWRVDEILTHFQLSETRCIRHLAHLDRLKLIELLPRNRVKLLVARNFKWRERGPIQRFFQEKLEAEFFKSRFDDENEALIVLNGMLSPRSSAAFQRKMELLAREFDELNDEDAGLPLDQRKGVTVVLAARRWVYGLFEPYRR